MDLDLGGQEQIANPTPEEIRHYLRFMPADSPFVVLSDSVTDWIQCYCTSGERPYHVEYKKSGRHYCANVSYELACDLFLCFRAGGDGLAEQTSWRRQYFLNNPSRAILIGALCVLFTIVLIVGVMVELDML